MADIAKAFRLSLLDDASLFAVVGNRIVPDRLPQGATLPAIAYRRISTRHERTIDGSKGGMAASRITVECYAATREAADDLAELVRLSRILDWVGVQHGVDCRNVDVDSGISHYTEPNTEGSHELRYISEIDFELTFLEAV